MDISPTSPFQKTNLVPIEEEYSYEATCFGLKLPTGQVVINFDQNTKYSMLKDIARIMSAEVVNVKGTWTFTPAKKEDENDEDE